MTTEQFSTALTIEYQVITQELQTDVYICDPSEMRLKGPNSTMIPFVGVWDTGASRSAISKNVVDKLRLIPIDTTTTHTANGKREAGVYLVGMGLPNRVIISPIEVTDGDMLEIDVLIGMDIVCKGDFAITHHSGKTRLTFCIPPSRELDFVKEINSRRVGHGDRNKHPRKKKARRKNQK